jgi:hypothetical protein
MTYDIKSYSTLPKDDEQFMVYVVTDSIEATNAIIHDIVYKNPTHSYLLSTECINKLEYIRDAWDIPYVIMVFKNEQGDIFGEVTLYSDNKIIPKQSLNGGVEFSTEINY